SVFTTVVATTT
nr:immunoglobulin heavy chain junction region [Mus musculus]